MEKEDKSPVIYSRVSSGTGILGCFVGRQIFRAPSGIPGGDAAHPSPLPAAPQARRSRRESGFPRHIASGRAWGRAQI